MTKTDTINIIHPRELAAPNSQQQLFDLLKDWQKPIVAKLLRPLKPRHQEKVADAAIDYLETGNVCYPEDIVQASILKYMIDKEILKPLCLI